MNEHERGLNQSKIIKATINSKFHIEGQRSAAIGGWGQKTRHRSRPECAPHVKISSQISHITFSTLEVVRPCPASDNEHD